MRARRRVAALIDSLKDLESGLPAYLHEEMGVQLHWRAMSVHWVDTLAKFEARDFLDVITMIYRFLASKKARGAPMHKQETAKYFVATCARIFDEEQLQYTIDEHGGVHFKVDTEFAATNAATIAALGLARYANAKAEFDKAMKDLSGATPDGKQAIRGVFNAAEGVFKLMHPKAAKLVAADAIKSLQTTVQSLYANNPTAQRAANKAVPAFGDWVDSCHNYRHEEGVEEPSQPPLDLAVQLIGTGSSFLRWLIAIDQQTKN